MRRALPVALLLFLPTAACAATSKEKPDFEVISYRLPETAIAVKLSMTLESCATTPIVSGEATLVAEAGGSERSFALTSRQLESAKLKRTMAITLHDTGSIATINSAVEDRTGSIIGNTIKFVASVAGSFFGLRLPAAASALSQADLNKSACSQPIQAALSRVNAIDAQLAIWRASPLPATIAEANLQSKTIDRLAAERAALRVGLLHVDLEAPLDDDKLKSLATRKSETSTVDLKPMQKAWLQEGPSAAKVDITWTATLPQNATLPAKAPAEECAEQTAGICFVKPMIVAFMAVVTPTNLTFKDGAATLQAKKGFPIPQWGKLQVLSLSAGFGDNRELTLTLDKFGRPSDAKWTSQARAETVTAGLASLASDVGGIVTANSKLADQKAEIEALTTQQTLNRLRACREILAAGGSACPADAPTAGTATTDAGN